MTESNVISKSLKINIIHNYNYLINKISEIEYETDHYQRKREKTGRKSKGEYDLQIKKAAKSRVSLTERKGLYEQEIDELQTKILKGGDSRQEMALKLEMHMMPLQTAS